MKPRMPAGSQEEKNTLQRELRSFNKVKAIPIQTLFNKEVLWMLSSVTQLFHVGSSPLRGSHPSLKIYWYHNDKYVNQSGATTIVFLFIIYLFSFLCISLYYFNLCWYMLVLPRIRFYAALNVMETDVVFLFTNYITPLRLFWLWISSLHSIVRRIL